MTALQVVSLVDRTLASDQAAATIECMAVSRCGIKEEYARSAAVQRYGAHRLHARPCIAKHAAPCGAQSPLVCICDFEGTSGR
jgi:hypothetical protein